LLKTEAGDDWQEGTPMTNVRMLPVGEGNEEITLALDELAREGARRMIAAALKAEADEYVERFSDEVGHATIAMTFDTYGHLMPGGLDEAAAAANAYLEGDGKRPALRLVG
jgi:hypothetical protein